MKIFFVYFVLMAWPLFSYAKLNIPNGLQSPDREKALEVLGFGSATKLLGDPYPLGGYSGIEIGVANEVLSIGELSHLGNKTPQQSEIGYTLFTFGKGLYNNLDAYIQFGLMGSEDGISNFGGQLRWGFYQAEYIPAYLSLVLSGNSVNYQNLITTTNQAVDLVTGVTVDDVTVYLGVGTLRSQGIFIGGTGGVTDDNQTAKENVSGSHYLAGINLKFSKIFLAFQIDRYTQSTYSAKVGVRF